MSGELIDVETQDGVADALSMVAKTWPDPQ